MLATARPGYEIIKGVFPSQDKGNFGYQTQPSGQSAVQFLPLMRERKTRSDIDLVQNPTGPIVRRFRKAFRVAGFRIEPGHPACG